MKTLHEDEKEFVTSHCNLLILEDAIVKMKSLMDEVSEEADWLITYGRKGHQGIDDCMRDYTEARLLITSLIENFKAIKLLSSIFSEYSMSNFLKVRVAETMSFLEKKQISNKDH